MQTTAHPVATDPAVLARYFGSGPIYTTYPAPTAFTELTAEDWRATITRHASSRLTSTAALYLQLPIERTLCQCARAGHTLRHELDDYLLTVELELAMLGLALGRRPVLRDWRLFEADLLLDRPERIRQLMDGVRTVFALSSHADCLIEFTAPFDFYSVRELPELGFNHARVRMRHDSGDVGALIQRVREAGFERITLEPSPLVLQQLAQGNAGILTGAKADRMELALTGHDFACGECEPTACSLALDPAKLLAVLETTRRAGYVHIGADTVARPEDALVTAQRRGRLQYSCHGYGALAVDDHFGLGMSAITQIGASYAQNICQLDAYRAAVQQGRLPVARGVVCSFDDHLRFAVIEALLSQFRVSFDAIETAFVIDFRQHFARELAELECMAWDGLIEFSPDGVVIPENMRCMAHAVAAVFRRDRPH
ncbi:hypothetical protein ACTSKR_07970 [Chitinibacteraceae bacterium HSL-7]